MLSNFSKHIENFSAEVRGNFFMPGHKGKLSPIDVTEFAETGDLTDSAGAFGVAEAELAGIFGAAKSHILVNGASVGNFAMILSICGRGDRLLVDSECHRSVPNALNLFGIKPVYVERKVHLNSSIHGGINPYDVERALKKDKKIKGVIITSPTYYGVCSDIRAIADVVHSAGRVLLVDEAHGAHFYFSKNLPLTAMEQGADMCVVSAHKTLSAPGQTAILNIAESQIDNPLTKQYLNMLQTSSPSFMLTGMMMDGIAQMSKLSEHFEKLIVACEEFAYKVNENTRGTCVTWNYMKDCFVAQKDQMRLVISLSRAGLNGKAAFDALWEKYRIRPEMHDENNIVCIVTACNEVADLDYLYEAILELAGGAK